MPDPGEVAALIERLRETLVESGSLMPPQLRILLNHDKPEQSK